MLTTINTNILSVLFELEPITLNMLIVIFITLIPVITGVIMSKKYNSFHGVVSFIFTSYVLYFLSKQFNVFEYVMIGETAIGSSLTALENFLSLPYLLVAGCVMKIPGAETIFEGEYATYILLTAFALVFIILQVIASSRKARRLF